MTTWEGRKSEIDALRESLAGIIVSLKTAGVIASAGCAHLNRVPVESVVTGELLARLCLDCDEQLDATPPQPTWPACIL